MLNKVPGKEKFEPRGIPCTFVGYSEISKAYRVIVDGSHCVTLTRDLKCIDRFEKPGLAQDVLKEAALPYITDHDDSVNEDESQVNVNLLPSSNEQPKEELHDQSTKNRDEECQQNSQARGRGRPRIVRTGKRGRPRKHYQPAGNSTEPSIADETAETDIEIASIAEIPIKEAIRALTLLNGLMQSR
uniref:Retroviral polymerase SH3-like domain-containing protein n=1 Tax=Trichuris muris TaxID=70415 RepID=A0A5S6Q664_TRIMR